MTMKTRVMARKMEMRFLKTEGKIKSQKTNSEINSNYNININNNGNADAVTVYT